MAERAWRHLRTLRTSVSGVLFVRRLVSLVPSPLALVLAFPAFAAEPAGTATATGPETATVRPARTTFDVDPVVDGTIIAASLGFASILDLVNSTGEIRPQQISPNFERSDLLAIDRVALSQTVDSHASVYSNVGVVTAVAFALVDPVLSGIREDDVQAGIADAFIYAESMSVTLALTNITKMAVRRPRPKAYLEAEAHAGDPNFVSSDTDSSLSFFSGHASMTAAIGSTATYLAFARSPGTARPWITLALATTLCTFVSVERVRAGAHFPTDVIAGSIAGAGVGVLVPRLHQSGGIEERRVWVGFRGEDRGRGAVLTVSGLF